MTVEIKARMGAMLLQDGDTGWRMYYQYLADRGPFNRERIWEPANQDQPAAIVPPVANFTDGPSGLVYYPGTGFGEQLDDTFLICDFRGGASNSGIRSFNLQPSGATYTLSADDQPIWTCLATDVAFGPDGALYVSDWVDGWDGLGKARIYRIHDPQHADSPIVAEVQSLLASQWNAQDVARLGELLAHIDRRVRLNSQWELAQRGETSVLVKVATDVSANSKARLHAVWGLGQIARKHRDNQDDDAVSKQIESAIAALTADDLPDLQVAALAIAGEENWSSVADSARSALTSKHARVRYAAIDCLGRIKDSSAQSQVIGRLITDDANDPAIRHAVAMYLARAIKPSEIASLALNEDLTTRLAAVVALRNLHSGEVGRFLSDSDPRVVLEAARAIHDEPIEFAAVALAELIGKPLRNEPLVRRVLNANFRIGSASNATAIAAFATRGDASESMRIEAMEMLQDWAAPNPIDRVIGDYRPIAPREAAVAAEALEPQIDLLMAAPEDVRLKAIDVAADLGIKKIAPALATQVGEDDRSAAGRARALSALAKLDPTTAVKLARAVPHEETHGAFGIAVLLALADHAADQSVDRFIKSTSSADRRIKQLAWDILARLPSPQVDQAIEEAVKQYLDGKLDPKVQLNVIEASSGRLSDALAELLKQHRTQLEQSDPLGQWLDSLAGGDPAAGEKLFFGKTELSCVRCHQVDRAGGQVGPNLTLIGKDRDERYLLESICIPDAKIAKGFETAVIADLDGRVFSGIVKTETEDFVELVLADGSQTRILKDEIDARRKGNSSMPADLIKQLTPRELRDLVAYLASLKVDPRAETDVE